MMLDNDDSTLRYAGCFFMRTWKKRYLLQKKVLKKGNPKQQSAHNQNIHSNYIAHNQTK